MGEGLASRSGRLVLATWVKLPAPEVVEILALADFDAVIIDLEHTLLDLHCVSTMIGLARLTGMSALVRVPDHQPGLIGRVLDAGASGVVVPQVDTVEQARRIVAAARFPPEGSRGLSNSGRAGRWGGVGPVDYMTAGDRHGVLIVQLESEAGIQSGVDIAAVPGVDCVLVGLADLAASLGCLPTDPRYRELLAGFERTCAARKVFTGVATGPDPRAVRDFAERGYRFVVTGSDATLLRSAAAELVADVRAASD